MPENTRSREFRHIYANAFSLSFGALEAQITCGIQEPHVSNDITMEEQIDLIMTHPAAKLLATMLTMVIADFEAATGKEIPLEPEKIKKLESVISAARAVRQAAAEAKKGLTSK